MTRKRIILLGIVVACVGVLAYAFMGPSDYDNQPPGNGRNGEPEQRKQEVQGFSFLGQSDDGVTEWVAKGARGILESAHKYRVFQLTLEVYAGFDAATGEQQILRLKSDTGRVNRRSNEALLDKNVVVELDRNTRLYTQQLQYEPDGSRMVCDEPVRLEGKDMHITGSGLRIEVPIERATILRDVQVTLVNVSGGILDSAGPTAGPATTPTAARTITVRCTGELVFQRELNNASFHDDVEVTQGGTTLCADELVVFLDPQTKKLTSAVATGNVTLADETTSAKGSKFTWEQQTQIATLYGDPKISILTAQASIRAAKAILYQKANEIVTEGGGYLVSTPAAKPGAKAGAAAPKPVEVAWKGQIVYKADAHTATFIDDVVVTRGEAKLRCDQLEAQIEQGGQQVEQFCATGRVRAEQTGRVAIGTRLVYRVSTGEARLTGEPQAEVRQADLVVRARAFRLTEAQGRTLAEGPGRLLKAAPASAQAADAWAVEWQGLMELLPKQHQAVFTKDVVAQRADQEVAADELTARFTKDNQLEALHAQGHVRIRAAERKGRGDQFQWDMRTGDSELAGKPRALLAQEGYRIGCERFRMRQADGLIKGFGPGTLTTSPEPGQGDSNEDATPVAVRWTDAMAFDGSKHVATFLGGVCAQRGAMELRANRLTLLLDDQNQIRELHATEHVAISNGARQAMGDDLRWDWATDIADLTAKDYVFVKESAFEGKVKRARYYGKDGRLEFQGGKPAPAKPVHRASDAPKETHKPGRASFKFYIDKPKKPGNE